MSVSNKRPFAGSRSPARSNSSADAARRMRMGLLGSTALIAASLAVSPAFAQTTIATPAGGGTITRTGGSATANDQTGAGGGVQISNVTQAAQITVNGVTINNTTGSPATDALRILGSTSGLNSTGVTLTGVNTLTTTLNGGAALYIQSNANMGVGITSSGSTFTGSYGINVQVPSGYVSFSAANQSQSFVANGDHIAGFNAVTGVNASIQLGSSTFTGFDTGINSSNFYGSFVEMTGGSINALVTGIRTDATGGRSNIQSQAAIVAPTGIHSVNTDGADVTTSGGGTINSTSNGLGTGIIATSSGGTANVNVTVGAAIGGTTRFGAGINAATTGGTGIVNVLTTAAITAGTGINMNAVAGATANVQGAIIAGTGIASTTTGGATNITTSGSGTLDAASAGVGAGINATTSGSGAINVTVGAAIGGTTAFADGVVISTTNPSTAVINFHNTAAITASTASSSNSGVEISMFNPSGRSTIDVEADITGGRGVYSTGGVYDFFVRAGATVTAAAANGHGINSGNSGSTLDNAGVIRATGAGGHGADMSGIGSITNSGTIEGAARGISLLNSTTINNTGIIAGGTGGGIQGAGAVVNNTGGTISGNWGIFGTHNNNAITNSVGGVITGVVDAIYLSGTAFGFLNNSGTINTGGGASSAAGIYQNRTLASIYTITNTGTITGGADATYGYAVSVDDGATTINNNSGGQLNSLTGLAGGNAIRLNSDDLATLNLNLGSTVNGRILSSNSGTRTTVLAGTVTGAYEASGGTGVDTITITGTGTIGGAVSLGGGDDVITLSSTGLIGGAVALGGGDDTFNWQGGTFGGTVNGGTQTATGDVFNSILGAGSGSLSLSDLSAFETYSHQSGTLTLTGSRNSGAVWNIANGATLNFEGSLTNTTGTGFGISAAAGATVNVLGTGVLDNWVSLYFNGGATSTATNSGSIAGQSTAIFSTSGRVNFTNNVGGAVSSLGAGIALASGGGTIINNGSVSAATNALTSSNSGTGGSASSLTNAGTLEGVSAGLVMTGSGTFNVTNTGSINGSAVGTGYGVSQTAGTVTIANNSGGSITGNGYAVNTTGGSLVLTNASGASISGGSVGAIQAATSGTATIDLQAGSTMTGDMILSGTGARTVTVAGAFSGNLDATNNSGAVNLTLNTSATGYSLLYAGSGADSLTFNGSGSRSFSVDNLTSWETGSFTGGSWTLTGTGNQNSFTSGVTVNGAALTVSNTQQFQGATGLTLTGNGSITTTASLTNTRTLAMSGAGSLGAASGQTLTQSGVVSGGGVLTLNGPGTVVLSGNNTYTGGTVVNAGILRLGHTSGAGTGLIRMIDPQIDFAVTGTYNNAISLEVVNGQQAADPTILNNTSGGGVTLAGQIYETAGVGGAGQYVTFSGAGGTTLTNNANSWGGVTRINSGATLLGTTGSISGASIVNNGTLTFQNVSAGTANQNISGSGAINIAGTGVTLAGAITTSGQLTVSGPGSSLILAGSRSGASNTGVVLSATGGSLTVANGASLQSGQYNGVRIISANATVNNLGLLQNAGTGGDGTVGAGIYVLNGGAGGTTTVNNGSLTDTGAGSTIQGRNAGVRHESGSTDLLVVNNYGLIVGDLYNGIENTAGGLTLNNFAGGYITATLGNGVSSNSSSAISVTNAGTIGRNIAGTVTVNGYGVTTNGVLTLVNQNNGLITGTLGGVQSNAAGSSITNQAGGAILGNYGVVSAGGTLNNSGLIRGFDDAVLLNGATALTNNAGGLIVGDGNEGVLVNANGSTISNAGLIVNSLLGIGANFSVAITNSGVIASGAATDAATTSAHISRNTGTAIALGAGGSVANLAGGEILGGAGVYFHNGVSGTLTNAGLIDGSITDGVRASGALTLNNLAGGQIIGQLNGVYAGALSGSNSGTIQSTTTGGDGALVFTGGSFANAASGQIIGAVHGVHSLGGALTFSNAGTITGGATTAFTSQGALTLTNTGTISSATGAGVTMVAGGSVTNSGTLTGGNNGIVGYGVYSATNSGTTTITNQSGGVINGGVGAIRLDANGNANIDLQAGSTTTGQILTTGDGLHNVTVAGVLNGAFNASTGAGVDRLTLAATGSMTTAELGAGADTFTYQGGSFSGLIDAGNGTDSVVSNLAGGSASLNFSNLGFFESFTHQSGTLTMTGNGLFAFGSSVDGGTLIVNGILTSDVAVATGAALSGGGTITEAVTVANGGLLANTQGTILTMGSLGLLSGSTINATFSGAGGPALFAVTGDLTLDGTVNVASTGAYGFGVYGLMTYGGVLTDNGLILGTTPGGAQRVQVQTSVAGQINIVHAPTELLFWDGGNGAQHDNGAVNGGAGVWTAAGSEWTDAGGLFNGAMQPQPGFAIFQGVGGTVTVDDVNGAVGVTGMQFAANGYRVEGDAITLANPSTTIRVGDGTAPGAAWTATIASVLTGAGGLVKTDLGTLILAGENDYTGGTTVDAGTLQIGDGATAGSILGSVVLANSSTLVFSRNDNHDFANAVSGTGSVGVNGAVTLSGAITASGGVDVYSGGEATVSNVNVASGSAVHLATNTLVTVAAGGSVVSQNGSGVESLGSSIYNYGSIQGTTQGVLASGGTSVWNYDSASAISGATGINNTSAAFGLTVYNAGTIAGSLTAVYSAGGVSLNNDATGTMSGQFAISALGNLTMANAGSINASATNFNNSGIYAGGTGTILNTGTITSGTNAIYTQGTGLLINSGLVQGGGAASTVRLFGANSSVTNLAGGEITTTGTGVGLFLDGVGASVVNSGTIRGGNAVNLVRGGAITNDGALIGTNGSGVVGNGGTLIANLTGGSITGATNGINIVTGSGSLTNDGAITGTTGQGVLLQAGGTITNTGSITGGQSGVRSLAALTLSTAGAISGTVNAIETVGVFNDSLTFLAGSTTTGAVLTSGGDDLVSLAGTLNGALNTGQGADTVTLFDTASLTSTLDGGDGVDAFILDGSGSGSIDIGTVLNFESRAKNGTGAWTLTGTDVSTAGWTINTDILSASGGSAINDAAFVNIGGGGALALLSDETIGALTGSGIVYLAGNRLTLAGAETTTYDGVIEGTGGLTIGSAYGLTLTGANTYAGATIVDGVLRLGASGVLDDASDLLISTGGVVELQGFDETVNTAVINGVLNGPGTLTAGVYALNGGSVQANLGTGLLINLGGVSTLSGASDADLVVVDGGTLALGASDRIIDTADLQVSSGAIFDLGAFDERVAVAFLSGTLNGTGTLTADGYDLNGATVNANLGAGYLYNTGGVSTLNGTSGADVTVVEDGTLVLGASDRLVDTGLLIVASGATFDLGSFSETVDGVLLEGTLAGTGTLTGSLYALDGATVNANLGSGLLLNIGGVSTLNGASAADLVAVLDGSLILGASNRLLDTAEFQVLSGATFDLGAFDETVGLTVIEGVLAGTGTLTADEYLLDGATVNANLGAGVLYSFGASTLNGTAAADQVLVEDGVLTLGASNRLSDAATVSVASAATLNLGAFNDTIALALLKGTLAGTGTLTAAQYDLNGATINANLGAGILLNTGGVSTLTGTSGAANVAVQAGTLTLGASDRLANNATVSVGSGSTLNLGAFNDTVGLVGLNGTLAGTGTLTAGEYQLNGATVNANLGAGNLFNTGGVSTLTGTSGAANVVVQAGTLTLGASDRLANNATVSVASGSTLNLGAFNDTVGLAVINGALNGTGTLTAAQYQLNAAAVNANLGAGALFNLTGVSTLTGTAAANQVSINAGTLRLGASERLSDAASVSVASGATFNLNGFNERIGALFGTGDVNVGAGRLTFGGIESGFGGRLSGAGSLVHTGGLFTLMGNHTIASISNTGGELRFLGTTTGGLSASGGSVTGAGTIGGALTASNGAVLSPGLAGVQNGIGGFTAGGLTLNGGTLAIDVLGRSGGNLIDQLRINGTATLTGGLLSPTFQGSAATDFDFSTRYLFLQANNLVGTFANGGTFTAAAQEGLFWRVRYDLSPNAAVLELRELTNFDPGATGTGNQRAVGQALSGGQLAASDDWAAILSLIAGLSAADRAAAFDSISGEPLADVTASLFSANDSFLTAVRDGGLNGRDDGGEALNFVDRLSFAGGRDNVADRLGDVLGAFDPSASTERRAGGWVSAYAGDQTLDGKPGQATVESTLNGFAGGYGVRNGSMSIGGAGGVTRLEGDVVARDGHYESDLSHAAGYVAFDDGVWAADVTASIYGGDLDTRRGITVGAFRGQAIGNTHVEGQALSASVARRFQVTDNTMIALGAIGTASNASVDGYTETGAGGLSLQASGMERDWQSLQLSARGTQDYRVNGQGFRVYAGAGVLATTGDRQATGDMRFSGAPTGFGTFTVEGAETPPLAGIVDFGLEVGAGEGVTVSAGYRGLFSERLEDNQVGVKLRVSW